MYLTVWYTYLASLTQIDIVSLHIISKILLLGQRCVHKNMDINACFIPGNPLNRSIRKTDF